MKKFALDPSSPDYQYYWLNIIDPHYINWMRVSQTKDFKKLWGKIEDGLDAGTYTLNVSRETYLNNESGNDTHIMFTLATTTIFGGKNYFIAWAYIAVGATCSLFSISFLGLFIKNKILSRDGNQY